MLARLLSSRLSNMFKWITSFGDFGRFTLSSLGSLAYLLTRTFKLCGFPIVWLWSAYPMKAIPEMRRGMFIKQLTMNTFTSLDYMGNSTAVVYAAWYAYPLRGPGCTPVFLGGSVLFIDLVVCVVFCLSCQFNVASVSRLSILRFSLTFI